VNQLHVQTNSPVKQLSLINLTGTIVMQAEGNNVEFIDVSQLKNGTYLLRVQTTEGVYNQKIIKK
jgi:hypothetical protein